jgi:Xaa-Pro aminopeptidase
MPVSPTHRWGLDIVEPPFLFEMQRQGLSVVDAQQSMLDARVIKSADEIMLLNQAAAMVDGVYRNIVEALKPGVRENEIVALANKRLYEMGSDQVEAVVTDDGPVILTKFPAQELFIANEY